MKFHTFLKAIMLLLALSFKSFALDPSVDLDDYLDYSYPDPIVYMNHEGKNKRFESGIAWIHSLNDFLKHGKATDKYVYLKWKHNAEDQNDRFFNFKTSGILGTVVCCYITYSYGVPVDTLLKIGVIQLSTVFWLDEIVKDQPEKRIKKIIEQRLLINNYLTKEGKFPVSGGKRLVKDYIKSLNY